MPLKRNTTKPKRRRRRRNGTVKRLDEYGRMRTFAHDAIVYEPVFNADQTKLLRVRAVPVRKTHPHDIVFTDRQEARLAGREHVRSMRQLY